MVTYAFTREPGPNETRRPPKDQRLTPFEVTEYLRAATAEDGRVAIKVLDRRLVWAFSVMAIGAACLILAIMVLLFGNEPLVPEAREGGPSWSRITVTLLLGIGTVAMLGSYLAAFLWSRSKERIAWLADHYEQVHEGGASRDTLILHRLELLLVSGELREVPTAEFPQTNRPATAPRS